MKIKDGFMMHKVGERAVVVAVGENTKNFHGMINLNSTGEFLWKMLENGATEKEMLASMLDTYEVAPEEAEKGVKGFVEKLKAAGVLEE